MEDKIIIKYIQKSNEKGLELLIEKYGGLIKAVVKRYLFKISEYEEECIDDILLSIWNNINKFDKKQANFKNWIISISRYRAIDYNRKYLKHVNDEYEDINLVKDDKSVEENILRQELESYIEKLLENLNEEDRKIFRDIYIEEKKVEDLASEMKVKKSFIYNRVSRGKSKLRNLVKVQKLF